MVKKIIKLRRRNLFGETPIEERKRLLKERIKAIQKGKTTNIRLDAGTTKFQKEERRKILIRDGLSTKIKRYNQVFKGR